MKDYAAFWSEAQRRRRLFFLWWIAWLPFGLIAAIVSSRLFGEIGDFGLWVILLSWFVPWVYIAKRLTKLRCPRCEKQAFAHPLFFMRHAKCQHCGLTPTETAVTHA